MRILAWENGSGSGFWRLKDPFKYLNRKGHEAVVTRKDIATCYKQGLLDWADILIPQGIVDKEGLACLYMYQQEKGKKIVVDQDDRLEVNRSNPHYREHKVTDARIVVKKSLEIADLVTTTNSYLAKRLAKINPKVAVLPNYIDLEKWELPERRNETGRIKMGWCGSVTHYYDLKMIERPIKRILREFPKVDFLTIGDPRYRLMFKGYRVEVMLGVAFEGWPSKLNGLRLDIGLAPLVDNDFNWCKSPIKWMEYGINRVPGVFSPTVYGDICREFDGRFGLIAHDEEQWYRCMKNLITCKNLRHDLGVASYTRIKSKHGLADHAYKWEQVYKGVLR